MIAKAVCRRDGRGVGMVFELDIPYEGFKYVWVSGVFAPFSGPETMAFGCTDETGEECDFGGLYDIRGEINLARVLEEMGYEVDWNGRLIRDKDQQLRGMDSLTDWERTVDDMPADVQERVRKLQKESLREATEEIDN